MTSGNELYIFYHKEPLPCVLSEWTKWGAPDTNGTSSRHRKVIRPALSNGEKCGDLLQIRKGQFNYEYIKR